MLIWGISNKVRGSEQASLFNVQIVSASNSDHFDDHNDNITTDSDDDVNEFDHFWTIALSRIVKLLVI